MEATSQDIFLQISSSQLKSVLDEVLHTRSQVAIRGGDKVIRLATLHKHNLKSFSLDFSEPMAFEKEEEITFHFTSKGEKYFSRAKLFGQLKEDVVTFNFLSEVYRVQRRANFRLSVPENEQYRIDLYTEDLEFIGGYQLKDISAGGCRIYFRDGYPERLRERRTLIGKLKIWGTEQMGVECEVRHIQDNKASKDPDDKEAGIQFLIEDPKAEHNLLSLVFDLQKKLVQTRS